MQDEVIFWVVSVALPYDAHVKKKSSISFFVKGVHRWFDNQFRKISKRMGEIKAANTEIHPDI